MNSRRFKYTERDRDLLVDLYSHRFLTIDQLQKLHFPSLQTTYRRTKVLKDVGLITCFDVPGITGSVFAIARSGLQLVAESNPSAKLDIKQSRLLAKPRDHYFMRHLLAINDFRIQLRIESEQAGVSLLGFIPDYFGTLSKSGKISKYAKDSVCDIQNGNAMLSHAPDGVFALSFQTIPALFFLEIDRGTEPVSDPQRGVLKAMRFYMSYLLEGKYRRYCADFGVDGFRGFRLLFVTTTDSRIEAIRRAVIGQHMPDKAARFLWLSTFDQIGLNGIFGTKWVSADMQDESMYLMLPQKVSNEDKDAEQRGGHE